LSWDEFNPRFNLFLYFNGAKISLWLWLNRKVSNLQGRFFMKKEIHELEEEARQLNAEASKLRAEANKQAAEYALKNQKVKWYEVTILFGIIAATVAATKAFL
jgi:FtsZ-binding cell division protein ZapB